MTEPTFLALLTHDYLQLVDKEPESYPHLTKKEDSAAKDMDGLKMVVDADELFAQIQPQLDSSDFYLLMVNGQQGSGKSTLARELTHKVHSLGYQPLYSSGFDIIEAPEEFVKQAGGHDKVCVILDDLSYVMSATSAKTQSKIKSFFALIRHFLKAKIFVIVIAHFTTAVPPIFKNSNVWIFSKPTTMEYDAMVKIVGRGQKIRENLEKMFNAVRKIQDNAMKNKDVMIRVAGRPYKFRWGDKTDPGDGRLMLMLLNGEPLLYQSHNISCPMCENIGFKVNINKDDYTTARPANEDNLGGIAN